MRILSILISTFSLSLFALIEVGYAQCTIERGPPQAMMEYMAQVRSELSRIRSQAGSVGQCNGQQGTFSSERRALSTLKRVDEVSSGWGSMLTNFSYNVTATAEGGSRGPVTDHGKLLRNLEAEATRVLQSVASICALDQTISSGGTPDGRIAKILENNRKIEAYYWQVALGNGYNDLPEGMASYSGVLNAIKNNYNYETTRSCKGPDIVDDIETAIKRLMTSAGRSGKGNEQADKNWKDAIALFSGNNTSQGRYVDIERRILDAELSRQGLTTNAKKAILGRFNCLSQRTDETSTPEARAKAQNDCKVNFIAGGDNVTRAIKFLIPESRTTPEYIERTVKYDAEKYRVSIDMGNVWTTLVEELKATDEATNQKVLNDLVNTHVKIVTVNTPLKDAIQRMYDNCMKAQPGIQCPPP